MFSNTTGHLSIEQKIGVNLDGILFNPKIVLQLSFVTRELLVKGLRLPEVIVQDLEGVQDVGHLGHQLSLGGITLFLLAGLLSPITIQHNSSTSVKKTTPTPKHSKQ